MYAIDVAKNADDYLVLVVLNKKLKIAYEYRFFLDLEKSLSSCTYLNRVSM